MTNQDILANLLDSHELIGRSARAIYAQFDNSFWMEEASSSELTSAFGVALAAINAAIVEAVGTAKWLTMIQRGEI